MNTAQFFLAPFLAYALIRAGAEIVRVMEPKTQISPFGAAGRIAFYLLMAFWAFLGWTML